MHNYHCILELLILCKFIICCYLDDSDYIPVEETLVLDPSALEQRKCVDIETVNDEAVEPIEVFSVELRDPVGVVLGSLDSLQIGIQDDGDGKFAYCITYNSIAVTFYLQKLVWTLLVMTYQEWRENLFCYVL